MSNALHHGFYLGWMDDSKEHSLADKLKEAVARYRAKFDDEQPNVALVNVREAQGIRECEGLEIRAVEYVRPNHFWVGRDEGQAQQESVSA